MTINMNMINKRIATVALGLAAFALQHLSAPSAYANEKLIALSKSDENPMARGELYLMLQNCIYRGQIVHKRTVHPGLHEAIIEEDLWNEVQDALAKNRIERATQSTATAPSLLAGIVHDGNGERMVPTHANKKGVRYR